MKKKLALFDLDGTLFNTNYSNFYGYKEALNKEGYDVTFEYFRDNCNGRHYKEFLPKLTNGNLEPLERIHDFKTSHYSDYVSKIIPNEHLFNIARSIKNDYYLVVVTTASKKNTYDILNYFKVLDLFDLVLTHDDITKNKPNPEGFLKAMEHYKIDKENTIIFEDSAPGIEAAKATGATVFVINQF